MNKEEIPVKKNEHYVMIIDDIGVNGEGIGKIKGYTLFVQGALPEEKVEVCIVKTKKNFGYGKLIKVIEPSQNRIEPVCQIAKRCGGCQLQHLNYKAQLQYKTKKVKDIINRIGGFKDINVLPTIGMDNPYNYRNKAQFPIGMKNNKLQVGFYAARSHDIINMEECYIQHPINKHILKQVKDFILEYNISVYDEQNHKGLIRHVLTRVAFNTKEVMVCIVINGYNLPYKDKLIEKLKEIEGIASISLNVNYKKTNVILGEKIKVIWGNKKIIDYIGNLKFEISPLSFFQVNPIQTKVLYDKALEFASLTGNEIVWDAYCGIGTISLFLAKQAKKVYGVEIIEPAVEDAKRNALINGIDNVKYFVGKAEEVIQYQYEKNNIKTGVIIVDPPRKGCDIKLLDTIVKMQPVRIVYVSCDPATLARDLKYLSEHGYQPNIIQPVDMFPFTTHVECVVKIEKK